MEKVDIAIAELKNMDEMADRSSCIHKLNPLVKFITTVYYILMVASLGKYDLNRLLVMAVYPAFMFLLGNITFASFFKKLRYVIPLVMAVGIVNPFLDKTPLLTIGNCTVTGGVISMITLMLKGIFCLMASYALIATTRFDRLMAALRYLHVPNIIVSLMLLTYRYISVMMEEVSVMTTAYKLRAPGHKGIHFGSWGSFLGQLLLRSMDRASELYAAMKLRGFDGEFRYVRNGKCRIMDMVYIISCVFFITIFRIYDVASILGNILV